MIGTTIDKLPALKRQQVLDALLAGMSLRRVAAIAGCSHTQVMEYKRQIFTPAVAVAKKMNDLTGQHDAPVHIDDVHRAMSTIEPLRKRIAEHRKTVDDKMTKASPQGAAALISADLRGIELEAKLAGTLQPQHGDVVFQNVILMPKTVRSAEPAPQIIDVESKDVTDTK